MYSFQRSCLVSFFHFTTIIANFLLLINLLFSNNFACILGINRDNTKFRCFFRTATSVTTLYIRNKPATELFSYQLFSCSVYSKHNLGRGLSKKENLCSLVEGCCTFQICSVPHLGSCNRIYAAERMK